jgi:hypothetical protein
MDLVEGQFPTKNNSNGTPGLPLIPKWIGEVSFTVSSSYTHKHLKHVVDSQPTVDLAFMIRIEEFPKWESPKRKHACAQNCAPNPSAHTMISSRPSQQMSWALSSWKNSPGFPSHTLPLKSTSVALMVSLSSTVIFKMITQHVGYVHN